MEKRTYFCDQCKKKVDKDDNLCHVEITYKATKYGYAKATITLELCSTCSENIGFIKRVIEKDKIVEEPVQDLKDKLYDIVTEIVTECEIRRDC